jgi:hypothetical protein
VLAVHDKLTLCVAAGVPVPVTASVVLEGCALLVKVRVPLAAPVAVGLKVTVNEALCPAGIVTGRDKPLMLNTALDELAAVTVTLAPLAVRVPDPVPVSPTWTLPRARAVGATVSCPGVVAVPVPESGTTKVGSDALEVIVTLPVTAPADGGVNKTLNVTLCPAVSVTGVEIPLTLNPVPLAATCEIVALEPPAFVIVSDSVWVVATGTLPKLRLVGFDTRVPGVVPVPDNGMVKVGFDAVEVTVTVPVLAPEEAGVNETLKLVLWPAVSVTGVEIPLTLNPVPVTATCDIEMLVLPVFVRVSDRAWVCAICTLPKLRLVGFAPSAPAATPVPDRGIFKVGFEAVEVMATLPLTAPAAVGVNETLKLVLCPAVSVSGVVMPLRLNPDPLAVAAEIVMLEPPVFVKVSDKVCLTPTAALPKLRLVGFAPSVPAATPVPDSGIFKVGFDAVEVMATLPLTAPAAVGVNDTLNVAL